MASFSMKFGRSGWVAIGIICLVSCLARAATPTTGPALASASLLPATAPATNSISPLRSPLKWQRPIEEKCFYFLASLDEMPQLRQLLQTDSALKLITASKQRAIASAAAVKPPVELDITKAARFSDSEVKDISASLNRIFDGHLDARKALNQRLRESGMFVREQTMSDDDLIQYAWNQSARGLNHLLDVYGDGKRPFYPAIDSISFNAASADWAAKVSELAVKAVSEVPAERDLFFGSSMRLGLALLDVNGRDEAGRFEPMSEGENKAAIARIAQIDWTKYSYTCIVVPGLGPEDPTVALTPGGRARVQGAAEDFKAGMAPLIIVTGGYVHPNKTRFCEAVEMRRELIDKLGVPADAVLIDPHARHTTTNIRNAARLAYRYGIPFEKPALCTGQVGMISANSFALRCRRELGYEPARIGKYITPRELEIFFQIDSLEADPLSPLDP